MKVCTNCWMPSPSDTEHRVGGRWVCHDCVVEYELIPDLPPPAPKEKP